MAKGTINKVIILGRLGNDPEIRYMPSGISVLNISMATQDKYKEKQTSKYIDTTEWHRVVLFGKTAEFVSQFSKKGSLLYIEGKIRTNKWKDQSGTDRYKTEILASECQIINSNKNNNSVEEQNFTNEQYFEKKTEDMKIKKDTDQKQDFNDNDIPF